MTPTMDPSNIETGARRLERFPVAPTLETLRLLEAWQARLVFAKAGRPRSLPATGGRLALVAVSGVRVEAREGSTLPAGAASQGRGLEYSLDDPPLPPCSQRHTVQTVVTGTGRRRTPGSTTR
jgi:hypothetical protein